MMRYMTVNPRNEIVNVKFQFDTLKELVFTMVDIRPIVAL
jgi:hypothetical protein